MKLFRLLSAGLQPLGCAATASPQPKRADWPMFGQNPSNTANNSAKTTISAANVNQLQVKWQTYTVSAGYTGAGMWEETLKRSRPSLTRWPPARLRW